MSNTDASGLNHTLKATLIVPLGNGAERRLVIEGYPSEYPLIATDDSTKTRRVGVPLPKYILLGSGDTGEEHWLYSSDDIFPNLNWLKSEVQNILEAILVNDKQRQAAGRLVKGAFDKTERALIQRD